MSIKNKENKKKNDDNMVKDENDDICKLEHDNMVKDENDDICKLEHDNILKISHNIKFDDTDLRNVIYNEVIQILEPLEFKGRYRGNAHHLTQNIVEKVASAIMEKIDIPKKNGRGRD